MGKITRQNIELGTPGNGNNDIDDLELKAKVRADMVIRTLDGRIYVYVRSFGKEARRNLAKWSGLEFPYSLINADFTVKAKDVFTARLYD